MSIWDKAGERPLTSDDKAKLHYGMSKQFSQFVAGMMAYSRELAVFIAPNINSYKRYASLSWAPVNIVWGRDNRTTGFRLVGHGPSLHVENRRPAKGSKGKGIPGRERAGCRGQLTGRSASAGRARPRWAFSGRESAIPT